MALERGTSEGDPADDDRHRWREKRRDLERMDVFGDLFKG